MAVVGGAGARGLTALELRQIHVARPGSRVGGECDPERRTSAGPVLHPGATVVQRRRSSTWLDGVTSVGSVIQPTSTTRNDGR